MEGLKCVCGCYGLLVLAPRSELFPKDDPLITNSIISGLIIISYLDCCDISSNNIWLYSIYSTLFLYTNQPKFGIFNGFACMDCQSYSLVLVDLSITEKAAIMRIYLVVSILKLRLSGIFNPAAYNCIKKHTVFLLQNLSLLFNLFFSPLVALYNMICIVWIGRGH